MINNRQTGRRRGRGGQRPQSGQGRPEQGNRIDNRARGNASQLNEKYKTLARDAQTQGDRVMAEYYLQFADHYFRVLSESRARFEENGNNNNNRRPREDMQDDDYDADEGRAETGETEEGERGEDDYRQQRRDRNRDRDRQPSPRQEEAGEARGDEREERPERTERPERAERTERPERAQRAERPEREDRRPRTPRPRREESPVANGHDEDHASDAIEADRLPPSFSLETQSTEEAAPRPKTRRPRKAAVTEAPADS